MTGYFAVRKTLHFLQHFNLTLRNVQIATKSLVLQTYVERKSKLMFQVTLLSIFLRRIYWCLRKHQNMATIMLFLNFIQIFIFLVRLTQKHFFFTWAFIHSNTVNYQNHTSIPQFLKPQMLTEEGSTNGLHRDLDFTKRKCWK